MSTRTSQQQLESSLWGAATIMRGTIDADDYKQVIFHLLFYKRLCHVFDEETQTALSESGGDRRFARFPENHRFQILPHAHWREVRRAATTCSYIDTHNGKAKPFTWTKTADEILASVARFYKWTLDTGH